MFKEKRAAILIFAATAASFAMLAACTGSGGNGPEPAVPNSNTALQGPRQNDSVPLASIAETALPSTSGIAGTIALSRNNAPAGAMLGVGLSAGAPRGMVSIPVTNPTAFGYVSLKPSADVTLTTFPKVSLTLPSAPQNRGQFYAWLYNVTAATWTDLGTVTVSGETLSFGGTNAGITLKRDATYVVVAFTAASGASCPTPSPEPSCAPVATPKPAPTPSGPKVYITNACFTSVPAPHIVSAVTVYDEQGHQLPSKGGFRNVSFPVGIGFDSANQKLYITNTQNNTITVYNRDGFQLSTTGHFPGLNAPVGIAFDPFNRHLYVTNGAVPTSIRVYDENGNAVSTTGHFSGVANPSGIAFDQLNRRFYVTDFFVGNTAPPVKVFDENGNHIIVSGTFPIFPEFGGGNASGITFDPVNRHLYLSDGTPETTVYDENGNLVTIFTAGSLDAAFDQTNRLLYLLRNFDVSVRHESGNLVKVSGTFPHIIFAQRILVVP